MGASGSDLSPLQNCQRATPGRPEKIRGPADNPGGWEYSSRESQVSHSLEPSKAQPQRDIPTMRKRILCASRALAELSSTTSNAVVQTRRPVALVVEEPCGKLRCGATGSDPSQHTSIATAIPPTVTLQSSCARRSRHTASPRPTYRTSLELGRPPGM
jgi:hypothetical protein